MTNWRKLRLVMAGLGVIGLGIIFSLLNNENGLEVIFFNVGQGDSILIKSPYGQKVLIDGGPDETVLNKLAGEMPFYNKTLDLVILTHPHSDHVSGLVEVLKRYQVEKVLMTGVVHTTRIYGEFLRLIQENKIETEPIFKCSDGDQEEMTGRVCVPSEIVLGSDLSLWIIWPLEDLSGAKPSNLNDSSVVIKLKYQGRSFLLTGDIETEAENELLKDYLGAFPAGMENNESQDQSILRSDVLKIAHQGSDSSSGEFFLEQILPKYAIISVGDNNYGHPSSKVIKRLEQLGAQVLRTDLDGDIRCLSNEREVRCFGE